MQLQNYFQYHTLPMNMMANQIAQLALHLAHATHVNTEEQLTSSQIVNTQKSQWMNTIQIISAYMYICTTCPPQESFLIHEIHC